MPERASAVISVPIRQVGAGLKPAPTMIPAVIIHTKLWSTPPIFPAEATKSRVAQARFQGLRPFDSLWFSLIKTKEQKSRRLLQRVRATLATSTSCRTSPYARR